VHREFSYPSLPNPGTYFRLLQVQVEEAGDDIECSISIHDIEAAPSYIAISYTWGTQADSKTILVDGQKLSVRPNCHYTLKQAHRQIAEIPDMPRYIWIDAICIDQGDRREKNEQVEMMGKIYQQAAHVFACVGRDETDFAYLAAECDAGQEWLRMSRPSDHAETFMRFHEAAVKLSYNVYWSRVWIVQELALSSSVWVLCGDHRVPFSTISDHVHANKHPPGFYGVATRLGKKSIFCQPFQRLIEYRGWKINGQGGSDLETVLHRFIDNESSNPLDGIYGFLHLIDWSESDMPRVKYDKSPFQLAAELFAQYLPEEEYAEDDVLILKFARTLLRALKLDPHDPDVLEALTARESSFHSTKSHDDTAKEADEMHPGLLSFPIEGARCFRLQPTTSGALSVDAKQTSIVNLASSDTYGTAERDSENNRSAALATINRNLPSHAKLKALLYGNAVAGLLCSHVEPGDYVLCLQQSIVTYWNVFRLCLVVRHHHEKLFEIVGHAFYSLDWLICRGGNECVDLNPGHTKTSEKAFEIRMSQDDLMALAALCVIVEDERPNNARLVPQLGHDELVAAASRLLFTNVAKERFSSYAVVDPVDGEVGYSSGLHYESFLFSEPSTCSASMYV